MISVVIPAYNEEKRIGVCLEALTRQTLPPDEVIVVDNASTDRTAEIARSFADRLPIKVIHEERKGRGAARAAGFAAATGDIIFSTDADAVVPETWLKLLGEPLITSENICAATGPSWIDDCGPWRNRIHNTVLPLIMRMYRVVFGSYWMSGYNFCVRSTIYARTGGFDPHIDSLEDNDLSRRVARLGRIVFVPNATVHVSGRRKQGRLIAATWTYLSMFVQLRFLRRNPRLPNVR